MNKTYNLTNQPTNRQTDIDIAKGIGIILVVWAHAQGPYTELITQFHMPFFFFISGLLYRSRDVSCFEYIKRKYTSLILPFWWWNFIFFPVFFILYYWGKWSLLTCIRGLIEIFFTVNKVPFLGSTWFLPALFWVSVFVHIFIRKICCNRRYGDLLLMVCGSIICILGFYVNFPYRISRTLICAMFYICGYLYNKYLKSKINHMKNQIACLGGIAFLIISTQNSVDMGANIYTYKWGFIVGALGASAFILRLSYWIMKCGVVERIASHLSYLGRNSIDIVIWQFLAFRITIVIQILVMNVGMNVITAFPIYDSSGAWWILYLLTGIYGSLLWKYILKHNPISKRIKTGNKRE